MKRERDFYKNRNLPNPKDQPLNLEDDAFDRLNETHVESDYHRQDEQVNVCLECMTNNLSALKRRFLRCSSQATITHLKKFVAKKVLNGIERYKEVRVEFYYFIVNWDRWTSNVFTIVLFGSFSGRHSVQRWTSGQRPYAQVRIYYTMAVPWSPSPATISTADWALILHQSPNFISQSSF